MDDQLCRAFSSWCGNRPDDRPGPHAKLVKKTVDWNDFIRAMDGYIEAHNTRPHTGEGMEGRTPLQVMAFAPRKRTVDEKIRKLLLVKWHRPVKVQRNGVGIRIKGKIEQYEADSPELQALPIGTQVRVVNDPDDILGQVTVWTMDYAWICDAPSNRRLNRKLPSEALGEAMRKRERAKRAHRESRKAGLDHLRDPVEVAIAALNHDSAKHRQPDPPDGSGLILKPVRTPLKVPAQRQEPLRKAVSAEDMDMFQCLDEFARKPSPKTTKIPTVWDALHRFSKGAE